MVDKGLMYAQLRLYSTGLCSHASQTHCCEYHGHLAVVGHATLSAANTYKVDCSLLTTKQLASFEGVVEVLLHDQHQSLCNAC